MDISIEFGDEGYGTLHRTGCKHLVDGESIGECRTHKESLQAADYLTGWSDDSPHPYPVAPCAKLPK